MSNMYFTCFTRSLRRIHNLFHPYNICCCIPKVQECDFNVDEGSPQQGSRGVEQFSSFQAQFTSFIVQSNFKDENQ